MNQRSPPAIDLFAGPGEMRARMRTHDWSFSPLGHPDTWPMALRTIVGLMLDSKDRVFVVWGPELGFLYNDAYVEVLGARHRTALGGLFQDIWDELWDDLRPLIDHAFSGEATTGERLPLVLRRNGYEEQTWFNFSYTPIRDHQGEVAGMYAVVRETTAQVLAERRLAFQLKITDALRGLHEPGEITATACMLVGTHLGVARVGYGDVDPDAWIFNGSPGWTDGTVMSIVGRPLPLAGFGDAVFVQLCAGVTVQVDDTTLDHRTADFAQAYAVLGMRAGLVIPLVKAGRLTAMLVIGASSPRRWSNEDILLAEDVAERTWATVERARAESTLRIERDRSQAILDSMTEGFLLLDYDFKVLQINSGALTFENRPASQIIGKTHWEAWPGSEQLQIGTIYKRAMDERVPLSLEQLYVYPDGRRVWFDIRATPVDEGLALVYSDVSERKATEESLRRSNESLEARAAANAAERDRVWRMSQDILAAASFNGYFVNVNPAFAAILGWSAQEATSIPFMELTHPDDRDSLTEKLDVLAAGTPLVRYESRALHKDGGHRWLSWTIVPEGEFIYGVGRDITVEKEQAEVLWRTEEALRQAQKMEAVGQLTGGLAHDFNNLLASIRANQEIMQLRLSQEPVSGLDRHINSTISVVDRAATLTQRLLAFSRQQTLDPKPTDVNRLVTAMAELIRHTIGPAVHLDIKCLEGLWTTRCDPNQLETSLLNLAINARDAMPDGGELRIETSNVILDDAYAAACPDAVPGEYVAINVIDTGTGMPPDIVARAFDPFFTTKPLGQGTGLGLSMVYGFVKQSGGHVRILSEACSGTTVRLKLPRHAGEAEADYPRSGQAALKPAAAKRTVLIVDDEHDLRSLLAEMLRMLGYETIEAADGAKAMHVLQSPRHVDLVVTDVGLPGGMNGKQLADVGRLLRPGLPVLLITGYAETASLREGLLSSGMQVMTKPFAISAFTSKVRSLIAE
jgi:PAS domain S-box-containing protein